MAASLASSAYNQVEKRHDYSTIQSTFKIEQKKKNRIQEKTKGGWWLKDLNLSNYSKTTPEWVGLNQFRTKSNFLFSSICRNGKT